MWIDASSDWLLFWRRDFIMIRFGSPKRDYSLSKGDMTLEKGLRSQHSKDIQLHSDRPWAVNELPTISGTIYVNK